MDITTTTTPDRIEKQLTIKAPRARVWRAITDHEEFGRWFGVELAGPFVPGAQVVGKLTSPEEYRHVSFTLYVDRIEPERLFTYRWHPFAVDASGDHDAEPTTLVSFALEEVAGGTRLTIVESGFDGIPLARRAEAFHSNAGGWEGQIHNIERYVLAGL